MHTEGHQLDRRAMIGRGPSQEEAKRGFQLARLSRVARSPETAISALGLEYAVGTVGCEWCEQVAHRWGMRPWLMGWCLCVSKTPFQEQNYRQVPICQSIRLRFQCTRLDRCCFPPGTKPRNSRFFQYQCR